MCYDNNEIRSQEVEMLRDGQRLDYSVYIGND